MNARSLIPILSLVLLAPPALAQQAEWAQDYEMPAAAAQASRNVDPILSAATLAATQRAAEAYRALVARGGWKPVPGVAGLGLGMRGPAVSALRRRLAEAGDLPAAEADGTTFDAYVKAALQGFQRRHGLAPAGTVNAATVKALAVPASARLAQLEANLARLASYRGDLGRRYVTVNIPGAAVETVEGDRVATRHVAGAGKVDRQSPIMNAKIVDINFNPFWNAPASIVKKDLIPKMQKDAGYLEKSKIRIFDGEREVRPADVNWFTEEATRYRFRQEPGADTNAMGFVRINIPNPHGVYMHDTPDKGIYRDDWRFISSGCVRVQNVRGYVAWLLKDTPGWDEARINEAIASGGRIDAPLAQPVPVYWTYVTAWSSTDGEVQFRDDIYGKDPASAVADAGPAPASPRPANEASADPER